MHSTERAYHNGAIAMFTTIIEAKQIKESKYCVLQAPLFINEREREWKIVFYLEKRIHCFKCWIKCFNKENIEREHLDHISNLFIIYFRAKLLYKSYL